MRNAPARALGIFRRYVCDFVNRHDFSVLPAIMQADYTLVTTGMKITGRDGAYSAAVRQQMDQFPGLLFTVHDLFVSSDSIGIHFTEHAASTKHDGATAAWPSIAIYDLRDGFLARCTIEQDYLRRRGQLAGSLAVEVPRPAVAPWDEIDGAPQPAAERIVRGWLESGAWLSALDVTIDDSDLVGVVQAVIEQDGITIDRMLSARNRASETKVAFHAVQSGRVAEAFAREAAAVPSGPDHVHLSGLVTVNEGRVIHGHVIRDRLGLQRRLASRSRPSS